MVKPITIKHLITLLEHYKTLTLPEHVTEPRELHPVYYDWNMLVPTKFCSYRGFYSDLALGFAEKAFAPSVDDLIHLCRKQIGSTHEGYKGGFFTMNEDTPVWVANYGHTGGTGIRCVRNEDWCAVLCTMFYPTT